MTTASKAKVPAMSFREREHRFSALTIREIMKICMNELALKNTDVQVALSYTQPNVVAMIKGGSMKFPPEKSIELARLFKLDPAFVLLKSLEESNAKLYDTINAVIGRRLITENENALLLMVRRELDGVNVNLADSPSFVDVAKPVIGELKLRAVAEKQASIDRIDREQRPGKKPA